LRLGLAELAMSSSARASRASDARQRAGAATDEVGWSVMKIEPPMTREIRIVQKGPLRVAAPVEEGPSLSEETVERVRREIRERGSLSLARTSLRREK